MELRRSPVMAQTTLALIKPEIVLHPLICWRVIEQVLSSGLTVSAAKRCNLTSSEAKRFYAVHQDRFFYNRLVRHMVGGPILALLLSGHNSMQNWRSQLGGTKVYRTVYLEPETLRGRFGLSDTRNVGHGCDSPHSFAHERPFFFNRTPSDARMSRDQLWALVFENFHL